jgi:hypothetical protein
MTFSRVGGLIVSKSEFECLLTKHSFSETVLWGGTQFLVQNYHSCRLVFSSLPVLLAIVFVRGVILSIPQASLYYKFKKYITYALKRHFKNLYKTFPNMEAQWSTLLRRIREVPSSNQNLRPVIVIEDFYYSLKGDRSFRCWPGSIEGQVLWYLNSVKWHWGRLSPNTSVSHGNSHSTKRPVLIYHPGLVQ